MQKWKKISIGVFSGVVGFTALYYGALLSLPSVIDLNKYKDSVSSAIEKETGFKVECEDIYFKKSLTPYLKIHMYHTLVLYPNDEVFLKLKEVDLKVKMLPLLFKKIVIKDAKLTRPIINITLYKDFSTSLEKYIDINKTLNTNGYRFDSLIYDTICENYKIKFNDETTGKLFYLEGDELLLKDLTLNDKAHVVMKGSVFEGKNEHIKYDIDVVSSLNREKNQFSFSPFKPLLDSNIKANVYGHLVIDKLNNINGNLKVSDLSLMLDNIILSGNEASLNFKGQEVDVDAIFHTSKKDSAKLQGKILFGKKKYLNINTKASNINLENLFKIISEVSEVLNIKNNIKDVKVKGFLDADFTVESDYMKLKSSGYTKLTNMTVSHKNLPYPITDINADINLENNQIQIQKAFAKVSQTPVEISGVINQDVSFDLNAKSENIDLLSIKGLFNLEENIPILIKNGKLSLDSNISGVLNKNYSVNSLIKLSDLKFIEKKNNLPVSVGLINVNLKGNDKKYTADIKCKEVITEIIKQKISMSELDLSLDDKRILIPVNIIDSFGNFAFSGEVSNYKTNPTGFINFKGDIHSFELANILKAKIDLPYKAVGKIKLDGTVSFLQDKANLKTKLFSDKDNYLSYVVVKELLSKPSVLDIDCNIEGNKLSLNNISLFDMQMQEPTKVINLSGDVLLNSDLVMKNLKVSIPNNISFATNFYGGEEVSLSANLLLNKTITEPDIKGDIKLHKYNLKRYLTSIKNADLSFEDNNIRVIAPDVQVNDSYFNIIADVKSNITPNNIVVSNLQMNSMNLDLNSLFKLFEQERSPFLESKLMVEKGSITINKFKILDLIAKDISSDIELKNNILSLKNVFAQAYAGSLNGEAEYDIANGIFGANFSGKNFDIKDSLFDLCKLKDNLEGRADFNTKFSINAGEYNQALKSLTGSMQFNATNGKMGTLGKFEYYLYAQNLLYHGILNATLNRIADAFVHEKTSHYRTASGNVWFQNGYLITDGIQTSGDSMSLFLKGKHNMITNQANIDIYGRISDEIKNKLGSFGNISISEMMNSSQEKKQVVLTVQPKNIMDKIPSLYGKSSAKTNTFKVNLYGNMDSLSAINSFVWIVSDEEQNKNKLPDFSDL